MKKLISILFFVALSVNLVAQHDFSFGNVRNNREKSSAPIAGVKVGLTSYHMDFAYKKYNKLPNDMVLKPAFGLFIEYPVKLINGLSIGADFLMINRGFRKSFDLRGEVKETDEISAQYFDIRIPVTYYLFNSRKLTPYIFVAPDFALCYAGTFSKSFPDYPDYNTSVDVSKSDALSSYDICLALGAGLRYNLRLRSFTMTFKLDGAYNLGFLNTNGATESNYVDKITYNVEETGRFNRGLEFMLSVGMPLKINRTYDACRSWR